MNPQNSSIFTKYPPSSRITTRWSSSVTACAHHRRQAQARPAQAAAGNRAANHGGRTPCPSHVLTKRPTHARLRHRRRPSSHRHHHGLHRGRSFGDRAQGCRRVGRQPSWHPSILRLLNPLAVNMEFVNSAELPIQLHRRLGHRFAMAWPDHGIEVARRGLSSEVRPSSEELEPCSRHSVPQPKVNRSGMNDGNTEPTGDPLMAHKGDSWRGLEGRVCRLCHRNDGPLPLPLDRRSGPENQGSRRACLSPTLRHRQGFSSSWSPSGKG